jgi:DNA-binding MarR family transcriptional regulator
MPFTDELLNVERTKLVPVKAPAPRDLAEEIADYWCRENPDIDPVTKMLAIRLRRAAQHLERELRRELDAHATDQAEFEVLMTLRRARGYSRSAGALAKEWKVTSGAITNRITRLEARGWVQRDFDPSDRRQVLVTLTEEGVRRIDHLLAIKTETEQRVFGNIDRATINRLSADLRTLLLALEPPESEEDCPAVPTISAKG